MTPDTRADGTALASPPEAPEPRHAAPDPEALLARYRTVRAATEALCEPLAIEDYVVQSMPDVSPTKWHLAHVTWFFETFLLREHAPEYRPIDEAYAYLFNSYYVQAGERHCRDQRGYISRPTVAEVYAYRRHVDEALARLLLDASHDVLAEFAPRLEIGLNHEQQHQELLLTDIKHVLSVNPLRPAYRDDLSVRSAAGALAGSEGAGAEGRARAPELRWVPFDEGLVRIGHAGDSFFYDNERPPHRHFVEAFELANRPVTCGEYLAFMDDGGYERATLWLSEGWAVRQEKGWTEPFYWERRDGAWHVFTLGGLRPLDPEEPVCHLSYFEADAFTRWAGARLPTEQEWEVAARSVPVRGNLVESEALHPRPVAAVRPVEPVEVSVAGAGARPAASGAGARAAAPGDPDAGSGGPAILQMYGDVWEWTRSQYSPYPGYAPLPGALGEYNGKFMSNQFVLRGGSCATPADHVRPTYRNFFPADATWQFMGLRLARDRT